MNAKLVKNYTTGVPVSVTQGRIEWLMVGSGVSRIEKEYDTKGGCTGIKFAVEIVPGCPIFVSLPVRERECLTILWKDYVGTDKTDGIRVLYNARKKLTVSNFRDQASRVAWRLMQDWLDVQFSMIKLGQAEFAQVFLPYIVTSNGRAFFEEVKAAGFKGLLPERSQP